MRTYRKRVFASAAMVIAGSILAGSPNQGTAQSQFVPFSLPLPTPKASPSPAPSASPPPSYKAFTSRSTIYVLVAAPDATTATALSIEVAMRIAPIANKLYMGSPDAADASAPLEGKTAPMIIPAPGWTLDDLSKQCDASPVTTRGAIVVGPVEADVGAWNAFLYSNGYTRLTAAAFLVQCIAERKPNLTITWTSAKFVEGRWQQGGIPFLPLALAGTYFVGRIPQVTQPFSATTNHAPGTTVTTVSNGATSSTTTGGANAGTTNGAPTTNVTTAVTTGGDQTVTTSQQVQTSNTALASALGQVFAVASTFADKSFPGTELTTRLKHATARLADDLTKQLAADCTSNVAGACKDLFKPAVEATAPPSPTPSPAPRP